MTAIFAPAIRHAFQCGRVDFIPPQNGAAIWLHPEHCHPSLWRLFRAGFWRIPPSIGLRATGRALAYDRFVQARRAHLLPEPHWYLFSIGVSPEARGAGLGSQLLRCGLQRAAQSGFRCYLETSNPANVAFYEKHGFRVLSRGLVPRGGPPFWGMSTGLSNAASR